MVASRWYPKADTKAQNFTRAYPGDRTNPNVVVLHTTETGSWPGYSGGATAPNLTVLPDVVNKRLRFRQHFPVDMSSRALRNESGGVETNTLNAVQVELVGTCSKDYARKYGYFYWPDAPDWALKQLAAFLQWLEGEWKEFPLKDAAPRGWRAYPSSYGNSNGQRMTFAEWRNAYGVCGHQHVPENVHGDPGDFSIQRLLELARGSAEKPDTVTRKPTLVQKGRALIKEAADRAEAKGRTGRGKRLNDWLAQGPKR